MLVVVRSKVALLWTRLVTCVFCGAWASGVDSGGSERASHPGEPEDAHEEPEEARDCGSKEHCTPNCAGANT